MNTSADDFADQVSGVAALHEPVRRDLYLYVSSRPSEVSRDEAAASCGVSRALAAFHLDKLVGEGLLEPTYRRLSGRTGPGAGRPTKFYRRSGRQVAVSLPPRSYELAAKLFASVLDGPENGTERTRLGDVARRFGETVGMDIEAPRETNADPNESLDAMATALGAYGYEPYQDVNGDIRMRNCPFHALASDHRGLVCGMNLELMNGVVRGSGVQNVKAVLEPRPNECCVAFRRDQQESTPQ